jgi:hypothetical protein
MNYMRLLDWIVATVIALTIAFSVTILCIGESASLWLSKHFFVVACIAVCTCSLLLIWMFLGGSNSRLWVWMPPFCLFPKAQWIRWLVAVGTFVGTIVGLIEIYRTIR